MGISDFKKSGYGIELNENDIDKIRSYVEELKMKTGMEMIGGIISRMYYLKRCNLCSSI